MQGISIDCAIQDIRLMRRNVPSGYFMYESILVGLQSILPLQNQDMCLSTSTWILARDSWEFFTEMIFQCEV